jgi:ATP-dependent exoDNAse (exonuclease V) beta subunit
VNVLALSTDASDRARARGDRAADRQGRLLVEAAAGTGKTTVLVDRVMATLLAGEHRLSEIAIVTFTELAAAELRVRLRDRLAGELERGSDPEHCDLVRVALADLENAAVGTIHGFCFDLLRQAPIEAGLDPTFSIADPFSAQLLKLEAWEELLRDIGSDEPGLAAAEDLDLLREPALRAAAFALVGLRADELPQPLPEAIRAFDLRFRRIGVLLEEGIAQSFRGGSLARRFAAAGEEYRALLPLPERERQRELALSTWTLPRNVGRAASEGAAIATRNRLIDELAALRADLQHHRLSELARWLHGLRERYQRQTVGQGSRLDFDQLISRALELVRDHPDVRARFRRAYPVVMVDEFQDTDALQTELLLRLTEGDGESAEPAGAASGCFFVGDPKQSIYRFRGADLENYRRVREHDFGERRRVSLARNFRTVPEIAEWINTTLGEVMGAGVEIWEAPYSPLEAAAPAEAPAPRGVVRLRLEPAPKSNVDAVRELEAEALAGYAERLIAEGATVRDPSGGLRPAGYGDLALLLRKLTAVEPYERAFAQRGIPIAVLGGRNYYRRDEVHALIEVLRAIADPGDPVATVAALRGPGFGCSDQQLMAYALAGARTPRFDSAAVLSPATLRSSPDPEGAAAVAAALHRLRALRREVQGLPLADLVEMVLDRLGFQVFFRLGDRPEQRLANLNKAVEIARRLEISGTTPLSAFVRWLEALVDGAGAGEEPDSPYLEGTGDALRILSIHNAKGLEFPVVLLGGLAGGEDQGRESLQVYRTEAGPAELRLRRVIGTRRWEAAHEREKERDRAEEKRLLYVATTRARDLLVIPVAAPELVPNGKLSTLFNLLRTAQESVGHAGAVLENARDLPAAKPELSPQIDPGRLVAGLPTAAGARRAAWSATRRRALLPAVVRPSDSEPVGADVPGQTAPAPAVSAARLPPRLLAARSRAARLGKVAHALIAADLRGESAPELELLSAAERSAVTGYATRFLASPLAARARTARELLIEENLALALDPERVLDAQVDLAFREENGWVLVDYKTDRVTPATVSAAAAGYRRQLELYAEALRTLTGVAVFEAQLYFLRLGLAVPVQVGGGAEEVPPSLPAT